jgi:hypothetical protein
MAGTTVLCTQYPARVTTIRKGWGTSLSIFNEVKSYTGDYSFENDGNYTGYNVYDVVPYTKVGCLCSGVSSSHESIF